MATPAVALPGSATPAAPPAATPSNGTPGSDHTPASPAAGSPSASPAPSSPSDADLRTLRQNYESYKKLGDLDKLTPEVQGYRGAIAKVHELGRTLGYTEDSVQAAFLNDPVATIQALQQEAQQQARNPQATDPKNNDPRNMVREEIAPLMQFVQKQMTDAANTRFENEFSNLLGADPEFKDCPEDVRTAIRDMVSESFKHDEPAMQRLLQGKTSDIKKYVDGVKERFLKVVNAHSQWKGTRTPVGENRQTTDPGGKKNFTLDDIINGNDNATAAIPSLRR
jgi:hypothetical protein